MYNVAGFLFEDEATAELAKKEEEGIRFIKERTALDNPEVVYKLYTKLLEEKLFVTPIGVWFMMELQEILLNSLQVSCDEIPPIPVSSMVLKAEAHEGEQAVNDVNEEMDTAVETGTAVENDASMKHDVKAEKENAKDKGTVEKTKRADRKKNAKKKVERADDGYKKPFYVAVFFAVVFALSVVGMFVITEMSGNNVNIINYRNEILDEYSTWEAQLKEKEAELEEWEEELEAREQEQEFYNVSVDRWGWAKGFLWFGICRQNNLYDRMIKINTTYIGYRFSKANAGKCFCLTDVLQLEINENFEVNWKIVVQIWEIWYDKLNVNHNQEGMGQLWIL